jgi:hypothetical protein
MNKPFMRIRGVKRVTLIRNAGLESKFIFEDGHYRQ